jgi:purine-binding chemotaxis protein CheW
MTSPAVLAYVDELLMPEPADAPGASPALPAPTASLSVVAAPAARGIAPVDETPAPVKRLPAAAPVAPPTVLAAVAPSGRWLRMTVDSDHYAVELLRVQEVTRLSPIVAVRGAAPAVLGAMNLRGRIVPVFDLGRWLGAGEVTPDERARIVVVERNEELIGLQVTAVDDVFPLVEGAVEEFRVPGPQRRNIDRAFLGIARPGNVPTVLLDARALFD